MNQEEIKSNLLDIDQWIRILFMVGFAFAAWFVLLGLLILVVVQTLISLISGEPNHNLQKAGYVFSCWLHEIIQFLVYNTNDKPFPFAEFPTADTATTATRKPAADADDTIVETRIDLDTQDPFA